MVKWSTKSPKSNPIGSDKILLLDSEDANNNKLSDLSNLLPAIASPPEIIKTTNTDDTTDIQTPAQTELPLTGTEVITNSNFEVVGNGIKCKFEGRVKVTAIVSTEALSPPAGNSQRTTGAIHSAINGILESVGTSWYNRNDSQLGAEATVSGATLVDILDVIVDDVISIYNVRKEGTYGISLTPSGTCSLQIEYLVLGSNDSTRINELPEKSVPYTATTRVATEDPNDNNNETVSLLLIDAIHKLLQDLDANNNSISNVNFITANELFAKKAEFRDSIGISIKTYNSSTSPTAILYQLQSHGLNDILYTIIKSQAHDNTPGSESAHIQFLVMQNGSLLTALEIDGLEQQVKLLNGFSLDLDNNNIINSVLVTPTITDYTNAIHDHKSNAGGGILDIEKEFTWAVTDEDSPLDLGVLYITEPASKTRTVTDIILGLKNTPLANNIAIEILKETAINSNVFTPLGEAEIDDGEFTSQTATIPPIISDGTWEIGTRLKIELTIVDGGNNASGLKVTIIA